MHELLATIDSLIPSISRAIRYTFSMFGKIRRTKKCLVLLVALHLAASTGLQADEVMSPAESAPKQFPELATFDRQFLVGGPPLRERPSL